MNNIRHIQMAESCKNILTLYFSLYLVCSLGWILVLNISASNEAGENARKYYFAALIACHLINRIFIGKYRSLK